MTDVPTLPLRSGAEIPVVGLGTYSLTGRSGTRALTEAIQAGYRLIDSAKGYGNEREVGEAVRASGVAREELVITTKLPNDEHGHDAALRSFDTSIEALGLDTVDLYLIHWPMPQLEQYVETWKALIRLRDEGRVRSIGVSNFSVEQIERLEAETGETPSVNQVELRIGQTQAELRAFHEAHGIVTESYSPLKHGSALAKDETVGRIAEAHGVQWNQVVLRWNLQLGTVVIPRSKDAARQAANLDLFGFELDDDEMAALSALRP
jgi:diketogulonate reductase-like aldo/keto reductase